MGAYTFLNKNSDFIGRKTYPYGYKRSLHYLHVYTLKKGKKRALKLAL